MTSSGPRRGQREGGGGRGAELGRVQRGVPVAALVSLSELSRPFAPCFGSGWDSDAGGGRRERGQSARGFRGGGRLLGPDNCDINGWHGRARTRVGWFGWFPRHRRSPAPAPLLPRRRAPTATDELFISCCGGKGKGKGKGICPITTQTDRLSLKSDRFIRLTGRLTGGNWLNCHFLFEI